MSWEHPFLLLTFIIRTGLCLAPRLVPRPGPRSSAFSQGMAILILALPMPGSFASFVSRPQRPPLLECVILISSNLYDGRHGQQLLVLACRFFFPCCCLCVPLLMLCRDDFSYMLCRKQGFLRFGGE